MILLILAIAISLLAVIALVFYRVFNQIQKDNSSFEPDFSSIKFTKIKCDCV